MGLFKMIVSAASTLEQSVYALDELSKAANIKAKSIRMNAESDASLICNLTDSQKLAWINSNQSITAWLNKDRFEFK